MPVHFTREDWARIRTVYGQWWAGTLDRPLIKAVAEKAFDPGRHAPRVQRIGQHNCHDFSVSPADIIDAIDYELCGMKFLGDAFPYVNFDVFGPGVLAAFCGARLDNSSGRVWLFPEENLPIQDIHIHYNKENTWLQRIKEIYRAGHERWGGNVLMSLPDLGGNLDTVAVFRGSENLLMDLYDEPEEVHRLCREAQTAWWEAYRDLSSALFPMNPGYSDWSGLYSAEPSFILQSDFSYMIGPDMFSEFVLPYLLEDCKKLGNAIYHLDGIGELPHLDMLLNIKELNAVQWVYGDGQPTARHWIDIYKRIEAAGKRIYVMGDAEDFAAVSAAVRHGLYVNLGTAEADAARAMLGG